MRFKESYLENIDKGVGLSVDFGELPQPPTNEAIRTVIKTNMIPKKFVFILFTI
jgi:hypothetical protein